MMLDSDDPRIELGSKRAAELGLKQSIVFNDPAKPLYYRADDIHMLLGSGVVVTRRDKLFQWVTYIDEGAQSQAFLVGIRPIAQESAERKLLREWISLHEQGLRKCKFDEIAEKAKKLLQLESGKD